MVRFADKGRPLKPGARIAISAMLSAAVLVVYQLVLLLFAGARTTGITEALILMLLLGVAALSAVHFVAVNWRESVISVTLVTLIYILLRGDMNLLFAWPMLHTGVFLLPLFEPLTRQRKPALPTGKVIFAAAALTASALAVDYFFFAAHTGLQFLGLGLLLLGGPTGLGLVFLGMILVLLNKSLWAAWCGGLGSAFALFSVLLWMLLGSPWFP